MRAGDTGEKHLCVGGPVDGEWRAAMTDFFDALPRQPTSLMEDPAPAPAMLETPARVRYLLERIATADRIFWIWRPADQDIAATIARLIRGYRGGGG
jgi:hypothetical protein